MLTISDATLRLCAGELTAAGLLQACMQRIARHDPVLRAFIALNPDASAIAATLDQAPAPIGALHGIPIAIKDNIETADALPTTAGSLALADNVTGRDAPPIANLRAAGAVIIGKTNLSEWANFRGRLSASGWSAVGGQTVNAHDPARSPCGSSSGSAVAVAAGMVPAAIGTETDGSVICPAAVNGIVGMKPSVGLVATDHIVPISHTQDTAGPMTRTVADAATLLAVMSGTPIEMSEIAPGDMTLGVVRSIGGFHPGVDALFDDSLAKLQAAGVKLVDNLSLTPPSGFRRAMMTVLLCEFRANLNHYLGAVPDRDQPNTLAQLIAFNREHAATELVHFGQQLFERADASPALESAEYRDAQALVRHACRDAGIDALLDASGADALLAPSNAPAWMIDHVNGDHSLGGASTYPAVAGYPHITVPMGLVRGLPIGLSLFAGGGADAHLLAIAQAVEHVLPAAPRAGLGGRRSDAAGNDDQRPATHPPPQTDIIGHP